MAESEKLFQQRHAGEAEYEYGWGNGGISQCLVNFNTMKQTNTNDVTSVRTIGLFAAWCSELH